MTGMTLSRRARREPPHTTTRRGLRFALLAMLVASGMVIMLGEAVWREAEANLFRWLLGHTVASETAIRSNAGNPVVFWNGSDGWHALTVTIQCSIALYIGPFLFVAGLVVLAKRVSPARPILASAVAIALLGGLNQVRLLVIAVAYSRFGSLGFDWAHGLVGSILMLAGVASAIVALLVICLGRGALRLRLNRH